MFNILPDGTKMSGYVTSQENQPPRECGHCVFYKHDHCEHPVVMLDPEVKGESGKPKPVADADCCNFFQSPGKILMFGLRHGTTEMNEEGLHRGWTEVPLDEKGRRDTKEAAAELKDKGIQFIICSDLDRALETAQIVGDALGIEPCPDFRLRPINKGDFEGKPKTDTKEDWHWYEEHTDAQIPNGESIDQFNERYGQALDQYLCEADTGGPCLFITHNSNVIGTVNYLKEGHDADKELVQPGGIFQISRKNKKLKFDVIFKAGDGKEEGS